MTPSSANSDTSEPQPSGLPWWARNSERPYLRPSQVRRRTLRGTAATSLFTVTFLLGIYWVLTATEVKEQTMTDFGAVAHKQTTDALIGGCGPMYTFPDILDESGTVPREDKMGVPNRQTYPTAVPMYGPFWNDPAPKGQVFWSREDKDIPVAESLLRNMWDGAMVVYYGPSVEGDDIESLRAFAEANRDSNVIVVPWEETVRQPIPQFRDLALATWNASQSCHTLAVPALYDFRAAFPATSAPGAKGAKPPVLEDTAPLSVDVS